MGDLEEPGDGAHGGMALLGAVDLAPSSFLVLYPILYRYKAGMEMVSFRKLTGGSGCNCDIAADGDFPGDGAPAVESTDAAAGGDLGFHMAFLQLLTPPFG